MCIRDRYKLSFSMEMNRYLNANQQDFMQEDTQAGMIYAYLAVSYTHLDVYKRQIHYTHGIAETLFCQG